ncbi:D(1C) dopamine receptor-like [Dendronephthya gigantea]|uniref:D(1C) dopamine receptor-like n=1 Tax=Dendronephthya gigantea TaxID=151771 RepID=UPI00106CE3FF|nr:D(1C) dopamine receptor-like [Dendronephthya gigantea]XP_028409135.1 D(1C) dopamine receptor-like [Dendronephthya gigantea]XP_028409136.1 D(1C) dopamine receptor-like [Dendronephthya gigantea]XP_028409137.1 D(1C) dopamine receptor-like [Dendronephthya gigantea]XP_028409138.1 D(1C) dopamine receptor-like [Dendronephthya gigantea]XP_028409139.1 D(1C) dopamine receptor-like [Dendronephthya gigantea]XP_028409140.1 D(1C) dopamine receptor-like [Dendronephthya gigantea]XP_028409141.1 D(1C) dopa
MKMALYVLETKNLYIASALYVLISLMSIIGNSLVLAAYFKTSKIRNNRTNFLIVSLSCADMIAGCFAIPLYMYLMLIQFRGYNQSAEYFVYQFTDVFSITASVWHLAFISLERYFAIIWPVIHHVATSTTWFIAIGILWFISILSAGLSLELYKFKMKYIIYNTASLFGLPAIIIIFCYLSIMYSTIRRSYVTSRQTFERELKVSLTIFILIFLFIICWCPFFTAALVSSKCHCISLTVVVYLKALHFATSCVNPVVYAARIPDFRKAFTKILPKQIVTFVFCLLHPRSRESPPGPRARASSTLSSTLVMTDGGRRRATLLENKGAVDQLPVAKDSPMASSVTSNKCVTFLSDSPSSSATGVAQLTKV